MLALYMPDYLLLEEMSKRNFLFKDVPKDTSWIGGDLIVPFTSTHRS